MRQRRKQKAFLNGIQMAFWKESIVGDISPLNDNVHHLAGRVSWQSQLRAAVHGEITNLYGTGRAKEVQSVCVCWCVFEDSWWKATPRLPLSPFKYSTGLLGLILSVRLTLMSSFKISNTSFYNRKINFLIAKNLLYCIYLYLPNRTALKLYRVTSEVKQQ